MKTLAMPKKRIKGFGWTREDLKIKANILVCCDPPWIKRRNFLKKSRGKKREKRKCERFEIIWNQWYMFSPKIIFSPPPFQNYFFFL